MALRLLLLAALAWGQLGLRVEKPPEGRVEDIDVKGGIHLAVPGRPNGVALSRVLLYGAPEGGKPFWTSPGFHMPVLNGRAYFHGSAFNSFFLKTDLVGRGRVYVEFQVGAQTIRPRWLAETTLTRKTKVLGRTSRLVRTVERDFDLKIKLIEPVRAAPAAPRPLWGLAERLQAAADDWSDIPLLGGMDRAIGLIPAPGPRVPPAGERASQGGQAVAPSAPAPAPAPRKRSTAETAAEESRLSRSLYFDSLRDYRNGNMALVLAKLHLANALNPKDQDIQSALERMRQETRVPATSKGAEGVLPSIEAMQESYDLYFAALKQYGKGRPKLAYDTLRRASALDPANEGVGNALRRLERELAGSDDAH